MTSDQAERIQLLEARLTEVARMHQPSKAYACCAECGRHTDLEGGTGPCRTRQVLGDLPTQEGTK
jgi:hypothetical protein